jgi:peptide/nickel transport system substrate-binding protein
MKKIIAGFIAVIMLITTVTITYEGNVVTASAKFKSKTVTTAVTKASAENEKVLRMNEDNLGYPSVYTVSSRGRGYLLMSFIFDTLTWKDSKGVVPMLAKTWKVSSDKKEWTFNLNKKAKFTDGKPLTAEDVKFSYEYIMSHPYAWVNLKMIKSITAIDTYTVKIVLKQVYAPFLTDISGNVPIMPKHIWKDVKEPEKFNTADAVIGSGPFKLEKYDSVAGTYVYTANKNYFLGTPVIDKLILSPNDNPKKALENGEIDGAQSLKYGDALALKKAGKFRFIEGPGFWVYRMYFNFGISEFNKKELRQAMYYAINRNAIVQKSLKNGAIAGNPGHIHPDSEWYFKGVKQYECSSVKANKILDAAGMKDTDKNGIREYNGKQMEYELLITDDRTSDAEMIKKYMSDIGIKLTVKAMDQKSVDSQLASGKFQLALNGHGSFGGDPVLLARFASESAGGSTPASTVQGGQDWSNAQFDKLFSQQLKELNTHERYIEVAKLQQIIAEELPTLTLYYKKITYVYNQKKFTGWFFTKDGVALAVPTINNKLVYIKGKWLND